MPTKPTEYVPVRFRPDQLEQMDEVIAKIGGTRSDFVRIAVDERLGRMQKVLIALKDDPISGYHEDPILSASNESEASDD